MICECITLLILATLFNPPKKGKESKAMRTVRLKMAKMAKTLVDFPEDDSEEYGNNEKIEEKGDDTQEKDNNNKSNSKSESKSSEVTDESD
jgi:hypothetical protein